MQIFHKIGISILYVFIIHHQKGCDIMSNDDFMTNLAYILSKIY